MGATSLTGLIEDFWTRREGAQELPGFLHYSSDLSPDGCERAVVLRRVRAKKAAPDTRSRIRMAEGHLLERLVVEDWTSKGLVRATQIPVRARRPSAWAWSGRADVLLTDDRLVEIKRTDYDFKDPEDLAAVLSTSHQWQASGYHSALTETHGVVSTSVLYLYPGGSIEVPLEPGGLLIPADQIAAQEEHRARLLSAPDLPPVPERELVVKVWKTKAPAAEARLPRTTRADGSASWAMCTYCPFRGVSCEPGEDAVEVPMTAEMRDLALAEAESRWKSGNEKTPQIVRVVRDGSGRVAVEAPAQRSQPTTTADSPAAAPPAIDLLNPDLAELPTESEPVQRSDHARAMRRPTLPPIPTAVAPRTERPRPEPDPAAPTATTPAGGEADGHEDEDPISTALGRLGPPSDVRW